MTSTEPPSQHFTARSLPPPRPYAFARKSPARLVLALSAFAWLAALSGCGGGGGQAAPSTPAAPNLVSIAVTPATPSVAAGGTLQLTATGTYSNGSTQNLTSTATWASSSTNIATVASGGLASAVFVGQTTVTAASGGITSTPATLTVTAGFVVTGPPTTATENQTATLTPGGAVLLLGGDNNGTILSTADFYDPSTATFSNVGALNTAREFHTATLLANGSVLVAGGVGVGGAILSSSELSGPLSATDSPRPIHFAPTGSMTASREYQTATLLSNGLVLIAGGTGSSGAPLNSAELYNPSTGTFTLTGNLNTARTQHTSTLLPSGLVLIAGGYDSTGNPSSAAELYNPTTGTFTTTGNLTTARAGQTATVLNSGSVLLAGGSTTPAANPTATTSAEVYNPTTGAFTATTGPLNTARFGHTATLLSNGLVVLAGGENGTGILGSAELYEPVGGTFIATANLNFARALDSGTLLPTGLVLVAGGTGQGGSLASAELYQPASLAPPNLFSSTSISFGDQNLGSPSTAQSVTISNTGQLPLTISSIEVTGTNAADFAETNNCPATVTGSATCTINVTFTPSLVGSESAAITITDNATGSPQTITLSGTGVGPIAGFSPASLSFGTVNLGTPSQQSLTLSNTGTASLTLTGVVIAGTNAADFSQTNTCGTSVAASASCTVTVTFTPSLTTAESASLTFTDDAPGSPQTVAMSGAGATEFVVTGSLNTYQQDQTATLLNNGQVLIVGGFFGGSYPTAQAGAALYNPSTGTFTPTGSLNTARYSHTATLLNNGMVLIAGGTSNFTSALPLSSAEIYNPATGTFTLTGSMTTARYSPTATLLNNGMVLIAGGASETSPSFETLATAELYNPATGTFTLTGSMNYARGNYTATLLNNGMVLIAGGDYAGSLASAELYNPATGTFTLTGSMNTSVNLQTATLLNNGMVLIAGGQVAAGSSYVSTVSAELYNPATGTFAATGSLNTAREGHTATLLNNGMVLVAGGVPGANSSATATAELYNPATGTFTYTGALYTALSYNTATLLDNGMVLVVGGGELASAELYGPATLTPPNLTSIAINPSNPTIGTGSAQVMTATGTFSDNSTQQLASVTWSSSNSSVATVTSDVTDEGAVYGVATGTATISACAGSVCGSTSVTVAVPGPAMSISPTSLTFTSQNVGTASSGQSVTITSIGATSLTIPSFTITGSNAGDFSISVSTCASSVPPGGTCTITVDFAPTAPGTRTASLSITDNAAGSPQLVSLSGTGTGPSATLSSNTITFGNWDQGSISPPSQATTLTNTGNAVLTISSIALGGTNPSNFELVNGTASCPYGGGTLGAGSSCGIYANFTPTAVAPYAATISITDNAAASPQMITLSGSGVAGIQFSPTSLSFSTAVGTTSATQTFTVSNPSASSSNFTIYSNGISLTGSAPSNFSIVSNNCDNTALTPGGATCTVAVQFTPAAVGTVSASVSIGDNLPTSPQTVSLSGTGTAGFVPTGSLTTPREGHTATLLNNGMVLMAGGWDSSALTSAELYNPAAGTFSTTGSMNDARLSATATLLNNGMVLIAGGFNSNGQALSSAELYNSATGVFTLTGSLNTARAGHTATLLSNGMVLVAGGTNGSAALANAELYDPASGTFTPTGSLNAARERPTATLLSNGMVLMAGGVNTSAAPLDSAELYDPATGTFTATGSLNTARACHTATLLNNGMVLMAGGAAVSNVGLISNLTAGIASAELYNPATATFSPTASLNTARGAHTATLLGDGTVLMAGGINASNAANASAEVYDPTAGTFTPTGNLNTARINHTATLLNNGTVLMAGGYGTGNAYLASAELYEAGTLTPPNLVSIAVTPGSPSVAVGGAQTMTATGTFSVGGTQQLSSATWSSSNTTVATVATDSTNNGTVYGVATGSATIQACAGAICGSTALNVANPEANFSPASLTFGSQTLAVPSASISTTLSNPGNAPLSIDSIGLIGTNSGDFSQTNNCGSTLAASSSCTINMVFTPSVAATESASLYLADNAAGSPQLVPITGTGTTSPVSLSTLAVNFGGEPLSVPSPSQTITLTNNGTATLTLTSVTITGTNPGDFVLAGGSTVCPYSGGTVGIGASCNMYVQFSPIALGSRSATLSIADSASGSPQTIGLSGTGTAGFVVTGSLNTARTDNPETVLNNGMVLIVGGTNGVSLSSAELYNPASGTFTATGSLNTARYWPTATLLNNGMVLIAGGYNTTSGGTLSSAELYNPATGTFTATGSMTTPRVADDATLLPNGMVLIEGGCTSGCTGAPTATAVAELYNPATGTFTPTGSLNTARYWSTGTLLPNGTVLIAGGYTTSTSQTASAEIYNPLTGAFTSTGTMNSARGDFTATLLNTGMVLIAGGIDSPTSEYGTLNAAELYNPSTGTFTSTGSMNVVRSDHTATLLNNGTVLVEGGDNTGATALTSAEIYDPATGIFTLTGSLTYARRQQSAALLSNGDVLVVGGISPSDTVLGTVELYEPSDLTPPNLVSITVAPATPTISPGTNQQFIATGTFSDTSTQQLGAVAWSSSNTTLASISNDVTNPGQSLAVSNPASSTNVTITATAGSVSGTATLTVRPTGFVTTGSLNAARSGHTATLLYNGMVLVAGGENSNGFLASAELYNPVSGTFALTGSLNTARSGHTATLLSNGMVLVAGGSNSSGALASAEIYDPSTNSFTTTGSMSTARVSHTATLLPNGTVLMAGGSNAGSPATATATAEIYNPATGTFSSTGSMVTARYAAQAVLLSTGQVLIAGGFPGGSGATDYLSEAELYSPATGTFSATASMNTARGSFTMTLLNNGQVLAAGGNIDTGQGDSTATAELYNPSAATWTYTGSMAVAASNRTATLLNNGQVLVAGGSVIGESTTYSDAELYNPATATFTVTGSLNTARSQQAAVLLDGGMVLIVGGTDVNGNPLASAELF